MASSVLRGQNTSLYEKLIQILEGFIMKKFLLVVIIGMVLAIDIFGIVKDYTINKAKNIDHIAETTMTVYME